MEVVFLGTGCGVPSKRRASPALLIEIKEKPFLFDSGPGSLRRLHEAGIKWNDLTHIFYTHFHVDHIGDLPAILFAAKNPEDLREKDLVILGPKGLKDFYAQLLRLYGDQIISSHYKVNIEEMEDKEEREFEGIKIFTRTLQHTPRSLGYRIEDAGGKAIVYSGDTDYCRELVLLAQDADLAIFESSFPDKMKVSGHLTPPLACKMAQEAGCKRLVLTHFYPICEGYDLFEEMKGIFRGELILAEDLMKVRV